MRMNEMQDVLNNMKRWLLENTSYTRRELFDLSYDDIEALYQVETNYVEIDEYA